MVFISGKQPHAKQRNSFGFSECIILFFLGVERWMFCKYYIQKARSKTLLNQEDIVHGPIDIRQEIIDEINNKSETLEELIELEIMKKRGRKDKKLSELEPKNNFFLNLMMSGIAGSLSLK